MKYYPRITIAGQPPSKSNSYEIVRPGGGYPTLAKTYATVKYERDFFTLCPIRGSNIRARFRLDLDVFFQSNRSDLDNALKIVLDCLQQCGVIRNDRQCVHINARKRIDRLNPRIEFQIVPLEEEPPEKKPTKRKIIR